MKPVSARAEGGDQLPIRAIAALTGVNPMTLRTWERRYGLIAPRRTTTGHRLYTQEHVEEIRRVLALVDRGVPIGRVREVLSAERSKGARIDPRWQQYQQDMLAAVASFDERQLDRIYDDALSLYTVATVTRRLILPLLCALGERWQAIDGAIAEEHFFATYLRSKLGARLQHRVRYADGPRLTAACIPGEHHEIGLLLFGLAAHEAGLNPLLLGADTPLSEVVHAHRRAGTRAIVLSSSIEPAAGFLNDELPSFVQTAQAPVYVGGVTSKRHVKAIAASGAIPLGSDIEEGVRLLAGQLIHKERST